MKENVWRPIRTHAALRSSRAHVNTVPLEKITISSDFLKDKMKSQTDTTHLFYPPGPREKQNIAQRCIFGDEGYDT